MSKKESIHRDCPSANFDLVISQLADASIAHLTALIDALIGQSAAAEAIINQPRLRGQNGTVAHDLLEETDERLEAAALELRRRCPADDDERDVRFRGLLRYASLACSALEDLEEQGLAAG